MFWMENAKGKTQPVIHYNGFYMKRFLIFLPANSQNRLGMDKALMGNSLMQTLKQVGKRGCVLFSSDVWEGKSTFEVCIYMIIWSYLCPCQSCLLPKQVRFILNYFIVHFSSQNQDFVVHTLNLIPASQSSQLLIVVLVLYFIWTIVTYLSQNR